MRCIGRLRSEASPSKVAVIGQPATAPITSRQPVPELPKSSTPAGCRKPPTPTPWTATRPRRCARPRAPSARMALAVLSTSSPSSRPEIRVSPTARAPKISARCEIDLSPGTRTRPLSGPNGAGGKRRRDGGVAHGNLLECGASSRPPTTAAREGHLGRPKTGRNSLLTAAFRLAK